VSWFELRDKAAKSGILVKKKAGCPAFFASFLVLRPPPP
jgi:hypothetical protein